MFHFRLNGSDQLLFCFSIHLGTKNLDNEKCDGDGEKKLLEGSKKVTGG